MEPLDEPVGRPWGVTAASIVAIFGGLFTLLIAGFWATIPVPPPANGINGVNLHAMMLGMSIFFGALGILGIATGVGLFNLRPWARMSILGFAFFLASMAAIGLVIAAFVPITVPKGRDPNIVRNIRPAMFIFYTIPLAIGLWWVIQFTRPTTKAAFDAGLKPGESSRPLSISILGWMHLIGGLFTIVMIFAGFPLFIGGTPIRGVGASIGYSVLGALTLYIGWGLLKLSERARKTAIAYLSVTFAHGLMLSLVPSMRVKMQAFQESMHTANSVTFPEQGPGVVVMSLLFAFVFGGGMIWFLVKNKPAFDHPPEATAF